MKTWLFVPGHNAYMLNKALQSDADVIIVDWEDAVPENQKEQARAVVSEVLHQNQPKPRLVLRINSTRTHHYANDLIALQKLPVAAIMLSKTEEPAEVQDLAQLGLPIIPLIESAYSIENSFQIARAHPLVERLILGAMDLIADMGAEWQPDGEALQYIRSRMLIAGRAAKLQGSIDSVYPRLNDAAGLRQETITARRLGFEGKLVIHPQQIEVVREVFTPTPEQVEQAHQTIKAFDKAVATGRSAIRISDEFIDPPMIIWAHNILRRANSETIDNKDQPERSPINTR